MAAALIIALINRALAYTIPCLASPGGGSGDPNFGPAASHRVLRAMLLCEQLRIPVGNPFEHVMARRGVCGSPWLFRPSCDGFASYQLNRFCIVGKFSLKLSGQMITVRKGGRSASINGPLAVSYSEAVNL